MKAAKWLKWKVGAACAVVLVLLFQFVKSSPQFQLQVDNEAASKSAPGGIGLHNDDDSVMREWQQQDSSAEDAFPGADAGGGRRFGRHGRIEDGGESMQQGDNGFDTQTGRS